MGILVRFGKIVAGREMDEPGLMVAWEPEPFEEDGTVSEHRPWRMFNHGWGGWNEDVTMAAVLVLAVEAANLGTSWSFVCVPLDHTLMRIIDSLPLDHVSPANADRARWMRYWAKRCKETFGAEAGMTVSY